MCLKIKRGCVIPSLVKRFERYWFGDVRAKMDGGGGDYGRMVIMMVGFHHLASYTILLI